MLQDLHSDQQIAEKLGTRVLPTHYATSPRDGPPMHRFKDIKDKAEDRLLYAEQYKRGMAQVRPCLSQRGL